MSLNRKTVSITVFSILGLNLISFLLSYTSSYLVSSTLFSYISEYFTTVCESMLPLFSAVAMLCIYTVTGSYKKPLINAIFFSLSWLITTYLEYVVTFANAGYEIISALIFSVLWAVLICAAMYAEISLLFFIIVFAARIFATRRYGTSGTAEYILHDEAFDFSNPVAVGIFGSASLLFLYNLGMEIANTVSYISECAGVYLIGEILYLVFRYVFILALLLVSHLLSFKVKKLFIKAAEEE